MRGEAVTNVKSDQTISTQRSSKIELMRSENRAPVQTRARFFKRCALACARARFYTSSPHAPDTPWQIRAHEMRKSCSGVGESTILEVRRPRKLSRNIRKTVTERRRKPKRVSGVHFYDFGAVLDPPGPPKRTLKTPQIRKMTSLDVRSFPGTPN